MRTFRYNGPVKIFGRIATPLWHGETTAESAQKAISNLSYRYKKEKRLTRYAKVALIPAHLTET